MENNSEGNSRLDRSKKYSKIKKILLTLLQMALTGLTTFVCKKLKLCCEMPITVFVTLALFFAGVSVHEYLQRYQKICDDLDQFKSAVSISFDWLRNTEGLLRTANDKLEGLVDHLKEFLLAEKHIESKVIDKDLSDMMRDSSLLHREPLKAGLNEELKKVHQRVVSLKSMKNREPWTFHYLSLVVIFLTSIVLSPHYVYMGIKSGNEWSPYYNALPLLFFFGILQAGVQVALDDPFAFINEDGIDPRLLSTAATAAGSNQPTTATQVGIPSTNDDDVRPQESSSLEGLVPIQESDHGGDEQEISANRDDSIGGVQPRNCTADAGGGGGGGGEEEEESEDSDDFDNDQVILEMEASGTFQSNEQTKNKAAANDVKTTPVEHPTSGGEGGGNDDRKVKERDKQTKNKAATPVEHTTSAQVHNMPGKKGGGENLPIVANRDDSIGGVQPRNCTADAGGGGGGGGEEEEESEDSDDFDNDQDHGGDEQKIRLEPFLESCENKAEVDSG